MYQVREVITILILMMRIKFTFAGFLLLFLLSSSAFAQSKDFGIWYGAEVKHNIYQGLTVNLAGELRTFQNAGKVDQVFLETGLEYRITDYLSVAASYRLTDAPDNDSKYHLQHKLFFDLKGNRKVSRITLSGRIRYQARYKTYFRYLTDKIPDYTLRLKLKAAYDIPSSPVSPYIYYEPFIPLFSGSERIIGKYRASAGMEYKFSVKHSISAEYIFQRDYLPNLEDISLISIAYNFKF